MWRIFEAKPRTRLGRLSHARTHDDILDLVGDDGDDEDHLVGDYGDYDDDCRPADDLISLHYLTWR